METKMIDERLHNQIPHIAEMIDCGMVCYLNQDTMEVVEIPAQVLDGSFEADDKFFKAELKRIDTQWGKCIRIDPPESFISFEIMEDFATKIVTDSQLQSRLYFALSHRKPFRNFKNIIDFSECRQQWFDYRQRKLEEYVLHVLKVEIDDA